MDGEQRSQHAVFWSWGWANVKHCTNRSKIKFLYLIEMRQIFCCLVLRGLLLGVSLGFHSRLVRCHTTPLGRWFLTLNLTLQPLQIRLLRTSSSQKFRNQSPSDAASRSIRATTSGLLVLLFWHHKEFLILPSVLYFLEGCEGVGSVRKQTENCLFAARSSVMGRLRKIAKSIYSFVMSVQPSVRPSASN